MRWATPRTGGSSILFLPRGLHEQYLLRPVKYGILLKFSNDSVVSDSKWLVKGAPWPKVPFVQIAWIGDMHGNGDVNKREEVVVAAGSVGTVALAPILCRPRLIVGRIVHKILQSSSHAALLRLFKLPEVIL